MLGVLTVPWSSTWRVHGSPSENVVPSRNNRNQRKRNIIRVQIAQLSELMVGRGAAIPAGAHGKPIVFRPPRHQAGETIAILFVRSSRDDAIAFLGWLAAVIVLKHLREATPIREGLGSGIACGRKTGITCSRERGDIGSAQIVEILIERIVVQVAIRAVGAHIAIVCICRKASDCPSERG